MEEKYSPYCPVCSGCGDDICCSALICQQSPDGRYCGTYLNELKFAYRMNQFFDENIESQLSAELREEYDVAWNRIYDQTWFPTNENEDNDKD